MFTLLSVECPEVNIKRIVDSSNNATSSHPVRSKNILKFLSNISIFGIDGFTIEDQALKHKIILLNKKRLDALNVNGYLIQSSVIYSCLKNINSI